MPLISIWDYFRQRTRDAVLAGMQDALEVAEQNDQASSEYEAAMKLKSRLAATAEATKLAALPNAVVPEVEPEDTVDDAIDARLDGPGTTPAGPDSGASEQSHPGRRKRGRPRKDAPR